MLLSARTKKLSRGVAQRDEWLLQREARIAHLDERLRLLTSGRPTHSYRAFRDGLSDSCPLYCGARSLDARPARSIERTIAFGPFRLLPAQRLLLEGEKPVRLASRALDLLIALVEHPGEVVGRDELMARAWSRTFVEGGQPQVPDQRAAANAGRRQSVLGQCPGARLQLRRPARGRGRPTAISSARPSVLRLTENSLLGGVVQ